MVKRELMKMFVSVYSFYLAFTLIQCYTHRNGNEIAISYISI